MVNVAPLLAAGVWAVVGLVAGAPAPVIGIGSACAAVIVDLYLREG